MNQDNSEIFQCCQCGTCCSHIGGMVAKEDEEYIRQMAFGKLPIVQLIPIEKMTFPFYDWEAERFKKWQKDVNIDAKIQPYRGILDLNTNKGIIISYHMDSESCPFLKGKKCLIYNTKRAYVCRFFPFNVSPFINIGQDIKKESMFGICKGMESLIEFIPEEKTQQIKFLEKAFPDKSFENSVQFDHITDWINRTIIDLMKKKLIRPAINYPYEMFLKRFNNSEKIDFTDFLENSGYIGSKKELIKRFDANEDSKEKIFDFLQNTPLKT